VIVYIGQ